MTPPKDDPEVEAMRLAHPVLAAQVTGFFWGGILAGVAVWSPWPPVAGAVAALIVCIVMAFRSTT